MPFNRNSAFLYARKHWEIPCDDGLISVKSSSKGLSVEHEFRKRMDGAPRSDWQAAFILRDSGKGEDACFIPSTVSAPDQKVVFDTWSDLNDCAHYVTKCLRAGDAPLQDIGGVPILEQKLRGLGNTKTLTDKVSTGAAQRVLKTVVDGSTLMKQGDVILYAKTSKSGLFHSAFYLGDNKIACHTASRWNNHWNLYPSRKISLIHFTSGDPAPSSTQKQWLPGWWEVIWKGNKYYYHYTSSGRVTYTKTKPQNLKSSTATGDVEQFLLESESSQTGKWNGQDRLTATKLEE